MQLQATAIIEESFNITGRGIVLELQHGEQGLAKGTELIAENSGKTWIVKVRVLFEHAVHEQKIFNSESIDYMLLKFDSIEKRQGSIESIKERESNNIYQYLIEPVKHDEKPKQGEKLKINYSQHSV
jgi:hypothetical protein